MKIFSFKANWKNALYLCGYEQNSMSLGSWLHTQLEIYRDWLTLLGLISAIFTILGITMHSMLAPLWDVEMPIPEIMALLNTIITLLLIRWGLKQKRNAIKEAKLKIKLEALCQRLIDQLGKDNKEKQINRLSAPKRINLFDNDKLRTKTITYQADVILDITTPGEVLFGEASKEFDAIKSGAK